MTTAHEAVHALWTALNLPSASLSMLTLSPSTAANNAIQSSFKLGSVAQTAIGLAGLSAAHLHFLRSGVQQNVRVDVRHALLEFHSEAFYTLNHQPPKEVWDNVAGLYKTKDNSYVRIHTNFPHHRAGILSLLGLPDESDVSRADVQAALLTQDSISFETMAAAAGMCATALRSYSTWSTHPHAKDLEGVSPVQIVKTGDAPKRPITQGSRPLEGVRVLDLSRVLAGPICGRTLAVHGADVLLVTSPHLPALPALDVDTSRGKRTTQLDLTHSADRIKLHNLASDADVFLQAYRPGGLEEKGLGLSDLTRLRPGIVCANLTAWGWEGPWKDRRGFDSLVQTATGFNTSEAEAFARFSGVTTDAQQPKPLPIQALDHAAGYLLAFGINTALSRTITEGGSYEVRVSLAAVGQWIRSMGQLPPFEAFGPDSRALPDMVIPVDEEIRRLSTTWRTIDGMEMTALRHAAVLERTPVKEGEDSIAPVRLDVNDAVWLPRL
ncbi:hypothetical protein MIND_01365400 [Mycena indigotica]|uniref:CoA-transferase family III n=1 Tax=Mycena indigotica TaxID=2126181 RepID=A0A8H6S0C6_9AGAR|nr:uncharacterized protein MIND_01365400 [Mycena indigotica]KAF7289905.1 hypothetical protein MIND_01365400 [Mycena indigotica]